MRKRVGLYKILLPDDPAGRWEHGEIGVAMPNDFPKYDVKLDLGHRSGILFGKRIEMKRIVYFYAKDVVK